MTWQLQEATARFGELLDASLEEGPQIVARDGKEMAVLVPIDEWKRLQGEPAASQESAQMERKPTLKDVLLAPYPIVEDMMIPERGSHRYREPPEF
jgi:prevent-host-death family protein